MTTVSILGKGNMGPAIAGIVKKSGNTVELLGSSDTDKPVTGDIVVLAVPYPAISAVLAQRGGQFAGRIVVDVTNPLDFATFDSLTVPADSSATAEIQAALPDSRVIKGFSTTFAATLAEGTIAGQPTTVLLAGDDADAKSQLADIIKGGGLKAVDAGSLRRAREVEALGFLQITLAAGEKISWAGGFALQS
ncbi:MAG: Nucleoside-diphosphate-sugar epimerases [uncultured Arthrobacter sp.]|uniref:Nucleoside-diphosphate-sugar epimerases n=1 Tax=uncultured Arthrobacter sp. TaxID=114050 RepID=A0A6J4H0U9_9MICC|nr:NADPH-dependent F420 reductase [uncultured Arthrobacter sp.]CAA9209876.1 MAG: Nucleoside-diphosphate-sugar epimerases [uncultured Arthrobacter sp.]